MTSAPGNFEPAWLARAKAASAMLNKAVAAICIVLFALLVLTVVWQVFTRQVLQSPSIWSEELARYLFVWLGFFAAAFVFSERGHILMDFLIRKLPTGTLRIALILAQVALIGFVAVVFVLGGLRYAQKSWTQDLSALPLTVGPMFLVMPLSGILIIWYAVLHLAEALTSDSPIQLLALDDEAVPAPLRDAGETPDEGHSSDINRGI